MSELYTWFGDQPSRWPVVPVRRVCSLGTGHTPDRSNPAYWRAEECVVPWVTVADIHRLPGTGLAPLSDTEQHISEVGLANSAAVLHPSGTVMVSRTASIGFTCRIGRPMATTQAFAAWTPGPLVDSRYLLLVMKALEPEFCRLAYGSTHLTIYMPDIESIQMPLPPLAAQRDTADYLDRDTARIDALVAAKQRMVVLLEERRQIRRDARLSSVSASMVKLGRFVESISQGVSPEAEARSIENGEWGVLKLSAVKAGRFVPLEHKTLPPNYVPHPSMVPRTGDLLVTRANTPPLVGDVCAVKTPFPRVILSDLIYVLRLRSGLDAEYAAQALLTRDARHQISGAARGTSQSMVKLRGEDVKAVVIPVPNRAIQRSLVAEIAREDFRLEKMMAALDRSIQLLRERRQALITAAVTGQLDIRKRHEVDQREAAGG